MKRVVGFLVLLSVLIIGILFAVLNAERVRFDYYLGVADVPLSALLVATLSLGAVLGVIASIGVVFRSRREVARLRRSVTLAEKEVDNLRAIPIREKH